MLRKPKKNNSKKNEWNCLTSNVVVLPALALDRWTVPFFSPAQTGTSPFGITLDPSLGQND
jgi:hypothetical protein